MNDSTSEKSAAARFHFSDAVPVVSLTLNAAVLAGVLLLLATHHLGPRHGGFPGPFGHPEMGMGPGFRHAEEPGEFHRPFGPHGPDGILDAMSRDLSLTDAQKAQIKPLLEDARKGAEQAHEASAAKVRAVLTPDQQKQFDAFRAEHQLPASH